MLRFVEHDGISFACEIRVGEGSGAMSGRAEFVGLGKPGGPAGARGPEPGPWLILLHGLGGDRSQVIDLAPPSASRVLALDFRAHGKTEPVGPPEALGFAVFASDLAAVMDRLGIESAVLAGVSMGAGVAARFAVDRPDRVRGLVCIRPAWLDRPNPDNLAAQPHIAALLRTLGPERGLAAFRGLPVREQFAAVSPATAESLDAQFIAPHAVERAARLERIPASVPFDDIESLRHVRVPALVIGCERDALHPMAIAREWAVRLGVRPVVVPPKSEDSAAYTAAVQRAIAGFLQRVEAGRSGLGVAATSTGIG
jgi:pimeloyl-ACP methyl ester carboxylesterase